MIMECKNERNMSFCNCTFSCSKKGNCCDCLKYHRSLGELPACYFPNDAERSGNRSVDNFIRIYNEKGICWS